MVYSSTADGGIDDEIWYMTTDGATKYKLTTNTVGDRLVNWSPTEKRDIYVTIPTGEARQLAVLYVVTPTP